MCGNIKKLRFPDRAATDAEIEAAVLQYVRKISAMRKPSAENTAAWNDAKNEIAASARALLEGLKARRNATVQAAMFKPLR